MPSASRRRSCRKNRSPPVHRWVQGVCRSVSAPWRARESFLSPVKTGSQDRNALKTPSSKLGATVLMTATPPTKRRGEDQRSEASSHSSKASDNLQMHHALSPRCPRLAVLDVSGQYLLTTATPPECNVAGESYCPALRRSTASVFSAATSQPNCAARATPAAESCA